MFHRHVVALFYQCVFRLNITTWANNWLCRADMVHSVGSLSLEPWSFWLDASILVCFRSLFLCLLVLSRSWHIKFQTVAKECLIEIKSCWSAIETDFFTESSLNIFSSRLFLPNWLAARRVPQARYLLFRPYNILVAHQTLIWFVLWDKLFPLNFFGSQYPHFLICRHLWFKPRNVRQEIWTLFTTLLVVSGLDSWLLFSDNLQRLREDIR